jgi:hypothetical protein
MDAMTRVARRLPVMTLGVLLCLIPSPGCAGSIQGQVLDAQTGQPVAGAVVLGVWTKQAGLPGLSHTELVGVTEVEVDAQGHFTLERPRVTYGEESVTVYKFGYVAWNNLFIFPTSRRRKDTGVPPQILLEGFPPGESHQRHVSFISNATAAGMYGHERDPRFQNAIDREFRMR